MDHRIPIEEEKKEVQVERRVPHGRDARQMDRYIRKHHKVGSVIESDWERDSWPEKSVQASRDKQSDDPTKLVDDYLKIKLELGGESKESQSLQHQNANIEDSNSMRDPRLRKVGSMKNVASQAAQLQMAQNHMDSDRADGAQAQPNQDSDRQSR